MTSLKMVEYTSDRQIAWLSELAIDDLGLIAGGAGEEHMLRCSVCGQLDPGYMAADPSQYKGHKCYDCMMKEYDRLVY